VKWLRTLHNIHTNYVMISSGPKYLIAVKVAGTVKWNLCPVPTEANSCGVVSSLGYNLVVVTLSGFLAVADAEQGLGFDSNLDRSQVTRNCC